MKLGILAWTGYWVGLGIEIFVILVCAAILALLLTGVLFAWIATQREQRIVRSAAKAAEAEARAVAAEEAAALAEAQAEAEAAARAAAAEEAAAKAAAKAEEEAKAAALKAEEEAAAKAAAEAEAKAKAEEEAAKKAAEEEAAKKTVVEETVVKKTVVEEEVVKKAAESEAAAADAEEDEEVEEGESEFTVVHDGIVFNDNKTITELYEELSAEQQGYFDELREEALQKPDSELAISKNFVTVKIGKRNLIKLLIKRGVTVAEFMLENEALKQLRLSNTNKRGKSSIKVKPTVVQVLDLASLKVAVDTLNLAYEELMSE